jgi:hypothetical protein
MNHCGTCGYPVIRTPDGWAHRVGIRAQVDEELDQDHDVHP